LKEGGERKKGIWHYWGGKKVFRAWKRVTDWGTSQAGGGKKQLIKGRGRGK